MEMDKKSLGMASDETPAEIAAAFLNQDGARHEKRKPLTFIQFLDLIEKQPARVIRNIFQVFYDMMFSHVKVANSDVPDDSGEVNFTYYDCSKLFVEGSENPYFADRLFANRMMKHMEGLRHGAQQNRIYIFHGPHGCGKSTFLNNLLKRFESYANTEEGMRYEALWRIDVNRLGQPGMTERTTSIDRLVHILERHYPDLIDQTVEDELNHGVDKAYLEIPCISHDNPLLIIPKHLRRGMLDKLIRNDEFKWRLFTEKEYEWVFSQEACTVCSSIYQALFERLGSSEEVFNMLYARPYFFSRRMGKGISVFNPGDKPLKNNVITNPMLQTRINNLFRDSNLIHYVYSRFAKTNNGVYALMDIKSHNVERMVELHNIISEAIHKVEDLEENVNSLFLALMNPEDKKNIREFPSFSDRIQYINIPYVLDVETEVKVLTNIFGRHVMDSFLPMVMENYARVMISSRLKEKSEVMLEWIGDPAKYRRYCDENLMLLKMEIYSGAPPQWLQDDDRKALTTKLWRKIIEESNTEGSNGFSGRDSIRIFDQFYSMHAKEDSLITMPELCRFFRNLMKVRAGLIPAGFLESLLRMYDYNVLQQVKESLYYYNEERIALDVKNYISAVNFEIGSTAKCLFTGEVLDITNAYLESIENRLFAANVDQQRREIMRIDVLKEYTTNALSVEMMVEGKDITDTRLFSSLHERYVHNLKKRVLEPFLDNENFRSAIKDYDTEGFKTYDKRIQSDVEFLIKNMMVKFNYTEQGANEVCIYVIDSNLAGKFI